MSKRIAVYADWEGLNGPHLLGWLHGRRTRQVERFEYEQVAAALKPPLWPGVALDPSIGPWAGPQYPQGSQLQFGMFADACPDRWGRLLMRRRLERDIRDGVLAAGTRLDESDYLLGVHDHYRVGALRYRPEDRGAFQDDQHGIAAPPFVELRALEHASRALEQDPLNQAGDGRQWLRMLIATGGSLGGARPKASVVDENGHLWIAKFPSVRDTHDVGGWELVVNALAKGCGLRVASAIAKRYASEHHCFMVKRFDRTPGGGRLHFASAMTLTGRADGDDASNGASYMELAEVLIRHGAMPEQDLRELWQRIVFNIRVSNTDDHLRNHGFILMPGKGWRLSPAYDINPVADADGLKLNITEVDNALEIELAREVAGLFRVNRAEAERFIEQSAAVVQQWHTIAKALGLPASDCAYMAAAFNSR